MSDAKDYITKREIPQLFECLMTGLMYHRPSDHVAYLQDCLDKVRARGVSSVRWDLFLEAKRAKTPLAPVTPPPNRQQRSSRPSSRASSRADSLFEASKKPVLPPIGAVGAADAVDSAGGAVAAAPAAAADVPSLARPLTCPVLLVLGGPGSGKALVASSLAERYNYRLVSLGRLLRADPADDGAPASDAAALAALIGAVNEAVGCDCRGLVIEGYPRSLAQLEDFLEHIQRVDQALLLDYEETSLRERLMEQQQQRGDGGDAAVARRLDAFKAACLPAFRVLDDEGKLLVLPVDPGASDEAVAAEAARLLDAVFEAAETSAATGAHPTGATGAPRSAALTFIRQLANVAEPQDDLLPADRPPLVLVLGGPGSGRTTCLERLARLYDGKAVHIDATSCGDSAEALAAMLNDAAHPAGAARLVQGFPETEEALRDMYASGGVGAPDLAVLIDCFEASMMERLAEAGPVEADEAEARMARFKEETLPVVQFLDQAGKLCVVLGDREPDAVLKEVKCLLDFVLFNRGASERLSQQNLLAASAAARDLRARLGANGDGGAAPDAAAATEEEAAAAAKIQAGFRGFQTRKNMAKKQ